MEIVIVTACGFLLDLLFGDPHWLPHPIRLIGLLIEKSEKILRKIFPGTKNGEIIGGVFLNLIVLAISFILPFFLLKGLDCIHPWLKYAAEVLFCYQIFAGKSLKTESMRVYRSIKEGNLTDSRKYLSWIVGRDTENLTFEQITKAVVETVAENTSDGVIAPMLFMAVGGAPLGFLYKAANTLDSMVGYKNDRYINFGKFSAIADDVLNFIPARITAFVMILSAPLTGLDGRNAYKIYKRDRHNHASPNSAHPESACAGALNVQLAGDAYYFGVLHQKKTIGDSNRTIEAEDIRKAAKLMYAASAISLILFEAVRMILVVMI